MSNCTAKVGTSNFIVVPFLSKNFKNFAPTETVGPLTKGNGGRPNVFAVACSHQFIGKVTKRKL
jgi:hypothetical protein